MQKSMYCFRVVIYLDINQIYFWCLYNEKRAYYHVVITLFFIVYKIRIIPLIQGIEYVCDTLISVVL